MIIYQVFMETFFVRAACARVRNGSKILCWGHFWLKMLLLKVVKWWEGDMVCLGDVNAFRIVFMGQSKYSDQHISKKNQK